MFTTYQLVQDFETIHNMFIERNKPLRWRPRLRIIQGEVAITYSDAHRLHKKSPVLVKEHNFAIIHELFIPLCCWLNSNHSNCTSASICWITTSCQKNGSITFCISPWSIITKLSLLKWSCKKLSRQETPNSVGGWEDNVWQCCWWWWCWWWWWWWGW